MKISIIVPAHNEEKRICPTLTVYGDYFKDLKKKGVLNFEILTVLSACKDNTLNVVKKISKKYREIKYLNFEQGGKGFAVKQGFLDALKRKNHLIGFVDADMSTSPEAFYDLLKNINEYDGIIASRWKKGAIVKNQSLIGMIKSRIFNFLTRSLFLLPYKDIQCGAKLFKRKALKKIIKDLKIAGWAFDVELLYKLRKKGLKIKELATVWENKMDSKVNLIKVSIEMFLSIIKLRILNSPLKDLIRIYDKFSHK